MSKFLPRDCARTMHLEEGSGHIIMSCRIGDFLEMYKKNKTFRIQSPDNVDPNRLNPNAPWVTTPTHDVGSSHPIVARVLLQGYEMLKAAWFQQSINKDAVISTLHKCKELLLACDKTAKKIENEVDTIVQQISTNGISTDSTGSGYNSFPHVQNLETNCATFLTNAKKAIGVICELPLHFLKLPKRDNNFDDLGKTLGSELGETAQLSQFVIKQAPCIKNIIELRNYLEHSNSSKKTVIENFKLTADGHVCIPQWHLASENPMPIKEEMHDIVEFLSEIAEHLLIHLILATVRENLPFIVIRIEESKINVDLPIRYRLSLNVEKMNLPQPTAMEVNDI